METKLTTFEKEYLTGYLHKCPKFLPGVCPSFALPNHFCKHIPDLVHPHSHCKYKAIIVTSVKYEFIC